MIPYILAAVGGFLISDSQKNKFANGGILEHGDREYHTITKTIQTYARIVGLPEDEYIPNKPDGIRKIPLPPIVELTYETKILFTYEGIEEITIDVKKITGKLNGEKGEIIIDIKDDGEWELPKDIKFKSYLYLNATLDFEYKLVDIR